MCSNNVTRDYVICHAIYHVTDIWSRDHMIYHTTDIWSRDKSHDKSCATWRSRDRPCDQVTYLDDYKRKDIFILRHKCLRKIPWCIIGIGSLCSQSFNIGFCATWICNCQPFIQIRFGEIYKVFQYTRYLNSIQTFVPTW